MKEFSILALLLAALTTVIAIPDPYIFGLLACGNDNSCLARLYGRDIMDSSSASVEMTSAASTSTSFMDKIVTLTVDTYTNVPCSEETDVGESTTTVSQHTTSTDFIIVTITSSSSTSISSSVSIISMVSTSSTAVTLSTASTSSTSSIGSTLGIAFTSGTVSSSGITSILSIASSLSTASFFSTASAPSITASPGTASSTFSVGGATATPASSIIAYVPPSYGVGSTSSVGNVASSPAIKTAYIPPSYGIGSTTGFPTYSEIALLSSTSSVDALPATPQAITTTITQSVIPLAPTSGFTTLTTSSTSTFTTTVNVALNPSYNPTSSPLSSVPDSIAYISSLYYPTAIVVATSPTTANMTEEACSALSTVWVTVTSTLASSVPVSGSGVPANPLYSQLHSASSASSAIGGASSSAIHSTSAPSPSASLSNYSTTSGTNGTAPSTSPFLAPSSNSNTSNTAPALARGKKHVNVALVLCAVDAMVMFAV